MKIVPIETYDFESPGDDGFDVGIDDVSITYNQPDVDDGTQSITISSRNNGAGRYLNIKTDNWSIESIEQLQFLFDDFQKRAMMQN